MTSSGRPPQADDDERPGGPVADLLHDELRAAGSDARAAGATAEEVTADLTERLRRLRQNNAPG